MISKLKKKEKFTYVNNNPVNQEQPEFSQFNEQLLFVMHQIHKSTEFRYLDYINVHSITCTYGKLH